MGGNNNLKILRRYTQSRKITHAHVAGEYPRLHGHQRAKTRPAGFVSNHAG
jgi:hypothetical protein